MARGLGVVAVLLFAAVLLVFAWHALSVPELLCSWASPAPAAPAKEQQPVFWQFVAVTSPRNVANKAVTVERTWGSAVRPPLRWYTDNATTLLPRAVVVQEARYLAAAEAGQGDKFMTFKMQWVWEHAARQAARQPGALWFVRVWDDNYVFQEALRRELQLYNPDEVSRWRTRFPTPLSHVSSAADSGGTSALFQGRLCIS